MRLLCSVMCLDLYRAILSRRFFFGICFLLAAMMLSIAGLISNAADAIYLLGLTRSGSANSLLFLCLLPMLPFATSFAAEWNEKATNFWIIRLGCLRYSLSKVVISALSGFLFTATGMLIFLLVLSFKIPLFVRSSSGDVYAQLLDAGHPGRYLFFYISHFALSSSLFAVAALWVSTLIPHVFTSIAGPLVIYFAAHRFTTTLDIPNYLKAGYIVESITGQGTPWQALLTKLGTVGMLMLVMGFFTVLNIRKKVRHA